MKINQISTELKRTWDCNNPNTAEEYQNCKLESQKLIQEYINLPQSDIRVECGWNLIQICVYDDTDLDEKMISLKQKLNPDLSNEDNYVNYNKYDSLMGGTVHNFRVGKWSIVEQNRIENLKYKSYRL